MEFLPLSGPGLAAGGSTVVQRHPQVRKTLGTTSTVGYIFQSGRGFQRGEGRVSEWR